MHRRALLGGLIAMGGWLAIARAETPPTAPDLDLLEPIYALKASRAGLTLRVASRGCTTKADFSFYVDRRPAAPTVAFGRRRLDVCKVGHAKAIDLTFSYAELSLSPDAAATVLNSIISPV